MRNRFIILATFIATAVFSVASFASDREWKDVPDGLPYYKCVGSDKAFILGNNRIKVRTHVDGTYELISGERCWACFNADPARSGYGKNRATVYVGNKKTQLVGPGSLAMSPGKCEIYTGAGFARYDYDLGNGLKCSRMISVMPSETPEGGMPLFLVTLTFTNDGTSTKSISYDEAISPNYVQAGYQLMPKAERPLHYHMSTEISFRCIKASFGAVPQKLIPLAVPAYRAKDEFAPQSMFIYSENAFLVVNEGELKAAVNTFRLRPRKKHTFHIVIGFSAEDNKEMAEAAIAEAEGGGLGEFASMWKKNIPDFSLERNKDVRNELYRSAYSVEASTVYSDYFKDAYIAGDIDHSFKFGDNLTNRDHINAALQACCTDPALAKSIIRYVMKQTAYDGMIPDSNKGYGYITSDAYKHDLVQLDVFNAVAEYLKRTGDYAFLDEWMTVYPMERGEMQSVKSILERYFLYLRDDAYVSPSMSAVQASVLPKFVEQMKNSSRISEEFMAAIIKYTETLVEQFTPKTGYDLNQIPYLLDSDLLTTSQKRDILDEVAEDGLLDLRAVPGLAAFDGIEASSLFRNQMTRKIESAGRDNMDIWAIYAYFRLME